MKKIQLTQGKVALVDDADYEYLMQWDWRAERSRPECCWYATRSAGRKVIHMHRVLLASTSFLVDHKNGDGLDNQRHNLRHATRSQNGANQKLSKSNTSGYKGVSWEPPKWWRAKIHFNGRTIHIGIFARAIDAAVAHDEAAQRYFGEFARLNFAYDPACYV